MALSNPIILYGIHSFTAYSRTDRTPFGMMKVIGSASLGLSSSLEQLYAGDNKFAWAAESKTFSTELKCKLKAYPGFLFQLFLGATVTQNAADAAGTISFFANFLGTSVSSATTGIASIAVTATTGKANLKFGKYVIKALTSTTFAIQMLHDVDAGTGLPVSYQDDSLAIITTANLVAAASGTLAIPELGVTLTFGSAPAMVVGDTATFDVRPPSTKSIDILIGSSATALPNFGALFVAQKRATKEMFEIDAYNCVGAGLPLDLAENAFSQPEANINLLYDAQKDAVARVRYVQPA